MTHIWVPRAKIIEPKQALFVANRLSGLWKLEAVRPDGRRRLLADWFPNLITDAGLNVIGTSAGWMVACQVGTGTATPTVGDTALAAYAAGTTTKQQTTNAAQGAPPYYGSLTQTYRFAQGAAAGNLTEIGIATAAVAGTMFSRARILDGSGNPTSITVLADEFLDASYQLRVIPPASDVLDTINISGTDHDLIIRASSVTSVSTWAPGGAFGGGTQAGPTSITAHSGAIGAVTAAPGGTTSNADTSPISAYGNGNLYRETTPSWGLSAANFGGGGIPAVRFLCGQNPGGMGGVQVGFTPAILKTSSDILTLVLRHTWARGTP